MNTESEVSKHSAEHEPEGDNAYVESFFKTLKSEVEILDGRHDEGVVRQAVFFYIEAYYNRGRLHSELDYLASNMFYEDTVAQLCLPNGVKSKI